MFSFFHKKNVKKNKATIGSTTDIKSSLTLSEVKNSFTSAISNRLKHKGSIKSVNSQVDFVDDYPFADELSPMRKKSELNNEHDESRRDDFSHHTDFDFVKPKSSRLNRKSNMSLLSSGYFTTGRYKDKEKRAPSLGILI
jgi:hypothetical protein